MGKQSVHLTVGLVEPFTAPLIASAGCLHNQFFSPPETPKELGGSLLF